MNEEQADKTMKVFEIYLLNGLLDIKKIAKNSDQSTDQIIDGYINMLRNKGVVPSEKHLPFPKDDET